VRLWRLGCVWGRVVAAFPLEWPPSWRPMSREAPDEACPVALLAALAWVPLGALTA